MTATQQFAKETLDRTAAVLLLAATLPLWLAAVAIIKTFSRGPVFFVQERVGVAERPFKIFKFRTMHLPGRVAATSSVTVRDDPRLFPGARWLRKWKIDELPQLLNVLNGTMSLVGPRPTVDEDYQRMTSDQCRRAAVKPGLTGLAQINGGTAMYWPERIQYDLQYIDQYSVWRDVQILFQTGMLILTGRADTHPPGDDEWGPSDPSQITGANVMFGRTAVPLNRPHTQREFPTWPEFDQEQIAAVESVLRSGKVNYWTGDEARQFEREFAAAVDSEHAVALANGTVALELALYALGIGPGDEVIVPCRTFIATASAVAMRGARPVFADVDRDSQNITAATIEPLISAKTKAVIVVHHAGWPCDMDPILELVRQHKSKVIEDCAQAHGARYKGRSVGTLGDAAAFSFCQDKIITTGGEGGMLTTNDKQLWERAWSFKDHGKSWDAVYHNRQNTVFKWLHGSLGTNWRMTEMQAAIGRVALRRLSDWVHTRRKHAAILNEAFGTNPVLRTTIPPGDFEHAYYKFYAFLRPEALAGGRSRDDVVRALQAEGVPCGSGTCPEIYLEQAFADTGWVPERRRPVAQELGESSLMFPVHPTLAESDVREFADITGRVLQQATPRQRHAA